MVQNRPVNSENYSPPPSYNEVISQRENDSNGDYDSNATEQESASFISEVDLNSSVVSNCSACSQSQLNRRKANGTVKNKFKIGIKVFRIMVEVIGVFFIAILFWQVSVSVGHTLQDY